MTNDTSEAGLLPCPFCGEKPNVIAMGMSVTSGYQVVCDNDEHCPASPFCNGKDEREAIAGWNTRLAANVSARAAETCPNCRQALGNNHALWCPAQAASTEAAGVGGPTPDQIAACERVMDGLEAQADIWADEINLVHIVKNIGDASRKLNDRMPPDIREGFINRQEANVDALVRQAYLEGFMRGGDSRKAYDEARVATPPTSPAPVVRDPQLAALRPDLAVSVIRSNILEEAACIADARANRWNELFKNDKNDKCGLSLAEECEDIASAIRLLKLKGAEEVFVATSEMDRVNAVFEGREKPRGSSIEDRTFAEAAPVADAAPLNRETIQTLLDLLNPLHGEADRQTYDQKRENFDAPDDAEFSINITARMERDLTQAVCILENRLKDPQIAAPVAASRVERPTAESIAKIIDPVAFDPISMRAGEHPTWACRRETALKTATDILALASPSTPSEPVAWQDIMQNLLAAEAKLTTFVEPAPPSQMQEGDR